jgi:hypothetical protein
MIQAFNNGGINKMYLGKFIASSLRLFSLAGLQEVFLVIVSGLFFIFPMIAEAKTDREKAHLVGSVRTVLEEQGTWEKGSHVLTYSITFDRKGNDIESVQSSYIVGGPTGDVKTKTIYNYDSKRNKKESLSYKDDGSLSSKAIYTFNTKGKLVETVMFGPQGSLGIRIVEKYDMKEQNTETISYKPDGSIYSRSINTYNKERELIEKISYKSDKTVDYKVEYTYDQKGNMAGSSIYNADGSLDEKRVYTYNAKGYEERLIVSNADGSVREKEAYAYEFDSVGNWIKKTTSKWVSQQGKLLLGTPYIIKRTITYYESQGR